MTDEEATRVIKKIVKIHAPGYTLPGYTIEDMEQEGFIICWQAYKSRWDSSRPLENFLVVHLSKRFKTLIRDKMRTQSLACENNKKLMSPIDIDNVDWDNESVLIVSDDVQKNIQYNDIIFLIDKNIPITLRKDYLKMLSGQKVKSSRAKIIREIISTILEKEGIKINKNLLREENDEDDIDDV